ncbi:MAG: tripartite tricarboxylate transporter substrate binding protein [Limnohabitans sp.]|nr:tripartite tricarboxylate transporter substrate binding protein [Limnohabitans sp.]
MNFHQCLRALWWLCVFGCTQLWAQSVYPSKPVRLIVPFAPGGVSDTSARLIAEQLSRRLGQQVMVDNKAGASGNIGTQAVALAEPDGYTLLLAFDGTMVINPHVFEKVPFDTVNDFAPVGKIGDAVLVLVAHPGVNAKTIKELIALSKTRSDGLFYGTSGSGGTAHVAGELFKQKTGANLTHMAYRGGGQALLDVLGGTIPLGFVAVAGAAQHIKSGRVNALAVTGMQRISSLPQVPTFIESGVPDVDINSWVGLMAPARTPRAVVERLNTELNAVLADPEVREKLKTFGIYAAPGSTHKFGEDIKKDLARYAQIVKAVGIKQD